MVDDSDGGRTVGIHMHFVHMSSQQQMQVLGSQADPGQAFTVGVWEIATRSVHDRPTSIEAGIARISNMRYPHHGRD